MNGATDNWNRAAPCFADLLRAALAALAMFLCGPEVADATFIDETRPVDLIPGTGTLPDADAEVLDMSADGRYVLFTSASTELTDDTFPPENAGTWHLFRRDMDTDEIVLVDTPGTGARNGTMSADGSRVAYNAGVSEGSGFSVAHLRDLETGHHEVVSFDDGETRLLRSTQQPAISADGTRVAFLATGTGIDPNVTVEAAEEVHVYVRDVENDTTRLADCLDGSPCVPSPGGVATSNPGLSENGRYVMFRRERTTGPDCAETVALGWLGCEDIFVRDTQLGTTALANRADGADGEVADAMTRSSHLSDDGRHVLFNTASTNLLPQPMENGSWTYSWDYVRDLDAGSTTLVSRADGPDGALPDVGSFSSGSDISSDGDEVLFSTRASLPGFPVPPPRPGGPGVKYFVRHVGEAETEMVSRLDGGFGLPVESVIGATGILSGSADFVAFSSVDSRLQPPPARSTWHLYRRQITGEPAPPEVGEKVQLRPDDGAVEVQIPGSDFPEELERGTQIPLGSTINANDGALEIFSEDPDPEEPLRHMVWSGGEFVTSQGTDREALSQAILSGPLLDCDQPDGLTPSALKQLGGARPSQEALIPGRKVWGHGGKGHQSKGGKSSASVRGTDWMVWDTCDGKTVTYVVEGRVEVEDFDRGRTVFVNPGEFYVAPGPPDTAITGGPSGATTSPTPSFTFGSGEAWGNYECNVDESTWATCSSPWTSAPLADGSHTFEVRAVDGNGSVPVPGAIRLFQVDPDATGPGTSDDSRAPKTKISSAPDEVKARGRRPAEVRFRFSSDEPGSTFQCALDGSKWKRCSSPKEYRLRPGKHRFEVRAIDEAGNVDATPARHIVRVVRKKT